MKRIFKMNLSTIKRGMFITLFFVFVMDLFLVYGQAYQLNIVLPEEVGLSPSFTEQIDKIVNKTIDRGIIPGAVVLIAKDGKIVKKSAYGVIQKYDMGKLLKNPILMTTDILFDLASITKVMATTQAVMKLVSENMLNVSDPVAKYIRKFGSDDKNSITIADLLSHSSGLPAWAPAYFHASNSVEMLDYICNLSLEYKTGTKSVYSDFSFMLLGFVVEKFTGKRLDVYLNEEIYFKLGLKNTIFNPLPNFVNKIAATSWGNPYEYKIVADDNFGYKCEEDVDDFNRWRKYTLIGEVHDGNAFYANNGIAGHAGLFSTASDLAVLAQLMLNHGVYEKIRLYDKNVVKNFTKLQSFGRGYGWEMNKKYMGKFCSDRAYGHSGFTGVNIIIDPEYDLQIIILTNKLNNGQKVDGKYHSTWDMCSQISDAVYNAF